MWLEILLLFFLVIMLIYYEVTKQFGFFKDLGIPFSIPSFPFGSPASWKMFTGKIPATEIDQYTIDEGGFKDEKIVGYFILGQPQIVINDIELGKRILIKDFEYFMDRRTVEDCNKILSNFLTNLQGSEWKKMRSVMSGVFTSGKLKLMSKHIAKVGENFEEYMASVAEQGTEVDMKVVGGLMALDSIATSGFGIEINSMKDPENLFRVMAMRLVGAPGYTSQSMNIIRSMFIFIFPRLSKYLKISFVPASVINFFADIITKTYKSRLETGTKRNDIIDIIAEEVKAHKNNQAKPQEFESEFEKDAAIETSGVDSKMLEDEETLLISNALLFFFAGFETTSTAFSSICHSLAIHPEVQEKVIAEVEEHIDPEEEVTFVKLQELKYMDMVISETLRGTTMLESHERKCTKDYKVPGTEVVIPKDRLVHVLFRKMTKNPEYFVNPTEFDPENFNLSNNPNKFGLMAFGQGPRNCVGMRYALLTMKMNLVYFLRKHRFVRGPKTTDVLVADKMNPNVFENGVFLKAEKRA